MSLFSSFGISASGMTAEQLRMDVIASNLANADTTRDASGKPYQRRIVELEQAPASFGAVLGGVQVAGIVKDPSPARLVYDPGNPEANKAGYVAMPNVNRADEVRSTAAAVGSSFTLKRPVSYITSSRRATDGLHPAEPMALAELALPR